MFTFNAGYDLMQFINIVPLPTAWKGETFGLAIVNFIVLLIIELTLVPFLTMIFNWIGTKRLNIWDKIFKRKFDFLSYQREVELNKITEIKSPEIEKSLG